VQRDQKDIRTIHVLGDMKSMFIVRKEGMVAKYARSIWKAMASRG
jgi:hypothetical protein